MNISARLVRNPLFTLLWMIILSTAVLFLNLGIGLFYSVLQAETAVDSQYTTIAVPIPLKPTKIHLEDEGILWVISPSVDEYFTEEELAFLESIAFVKQVDFRKMTNAYSSVYRPLISLQSKEDFRVTPLDSCYSAVLLVVKIIEYRESISTKIDPNSYRNIALAQIEEVVLSHDGYQIKENDIVKINYLDSKPYKFIEGTRFLAFGYYNANHLDTTPIWEEEKEPRMPEFIVNGKFSQYLYSDSSKGSQAALLPAMEELSGTVEEFIARPENFLWRRMLEEQEVTMHSVPFIGTNCLESIYLFHQNSARIIKGRSFTSEEYETGAKVCILSEGLAAESGLSVGDAITISQYPYVMRNGLESIPEITNPIIVDYSRDAMSFLTEDEELEIIGIYQMDEWWGEDTYSFTPNTVFAPEKAVARRTLDYPKEIMDVLPITSIYGVAPEGVFLSVVLENGSIEKFIEACQGTRMEGRFSFFDQGYEFVSGGMKEVRSSALQILIFSGLAWFLILFLFLFLYQAREKKNIGIMRSLGASKQQARQYLFRSGAMISGAAVIFGGIPVKIITDQIAVRLSAAALENGTEKSVYSTVTLESASDGIKNLLENSSMKLYQILLCSGIQMLLLFLCIWLAARQLTEAEPEKFLKSKGGTKA